MNDGKNRAPPRRLRAIMAADGAGYSRLMADDPERTVAALASARSVFRRCIEGHGGRVVDTAGDSILASFQSASEAVEAALQAQAALGGTQAALPFRVGLHLGDVIEDGTGAVYGDGVNIAARLQTLAAPGSIAGSEAIHAAARGIRGVLFSSLGQHALKNIPAPVHAYRIEVGPSGGGPVARVEQHYAATARRLGIACVFTALIAGIVIWLVRPPHVAAPAEALPGKTVAVLPFESPGAPEDRELAEGLSQELIDLLSRMPALTVLARTSTFQLRDANASIPELAQRLGSAYVIVGTVRRTGERWHVVVRLVDGANGAVLWSDNYQREPRDLLSLQSELALVIAAQLKAPIQASSLGGSGAHDLAAWRLYLQAEGLPKGERQAVYERVAALDPAFAPVHVALAMEVFRRANRQATRADPRDVHHRATAHAENALRIDPHLADAYVALAYADGWIDDQDALRRHAARVLELNPSHPDGAELAADIALSDGRMDDALAQCRRVLALDPLQAAGYANLASALRLAGRPSAALKQIERALAIEPDNAGFENTKSGLLLDVGRSAEALLLARRAAARGAPTSQPPVDVLLAAGAAEDLQAAEANLPVHTQAKLDVLRGRDEAFFTWLETGSASRVRGWLLFSSDLDRLRKVPRFLAGLDHQNAREAHSRAQAWRAANPPQK